MSIEDRLISIEAAIQTSGLIKKEILTLEEAVIFTGLTKSYMYKLTSSRRIPHYIPSGKLIYFNRVELENWLLQNRIKPADEIKEEAQLYCLKNRRL